jgi:small subunit ribosomal protein S9
LSESENYVTSESSKSFAPLKTGVQAPSAGTGRRKEAIARVRIVPGNGKFVVNGKELAVYFPNKLHQQLVNDPFKVLGIARALNAVDRDVNRPVLKKAGFLTRDPRVIERKKAGLKKARKRSQYSKR